jgi:hypothetical protein
MNEIAIKPKYTLLEKVPKEEFAKLYKMLESITLPLKEPNCLGRSAFTEKHRACGWGLAYHFTKRTINLSRMSKKYPEIYEELIRIAHLICDPVGHEFTSIYMNRNNTCAPHKDRSNHGDLVIVSFGEYSGCTLMIEGENANAYLQPIQFDGTTQTHWNTNDLSGIKYSLVFYSHREIMRART